MVKDLIMIGNHAVVQGLTPDEYSKIMAATVPENERGSYWDFPRSEMEDGTVEDNGNLYFEIEQAGELRYFESAIPKERYSFTFLN